RALGCGIDSMTLENLRDAAWREAMTNVSQCTLDPVVTPTAIFFGHPDNQSFDLCTCLGPAGFPVVTSVVFVRDQFAMPRQQHFGRDESCDLVQGGAAQRFGPNGKSSALVVGEA